MSTVVGDRAVVAAWVGSTNLGDELVFSVLRQLLSDRGVETAVPSINPTDTATNHHVAAFGHLNPLTLGRQLRAADILVFGGGGLLQDETSVWNLPWHLSRIRSGRRNGVPWAGVGLGATGLITERGRRQVVESLCDHVSIAVRDQPSADLLGGLGVPRVVRAADLGWLADPPIRRGAGVLAVCLRNPQTPRWWPGALRPAGRTPDAAITTLAAAVDETATTTGLTTRLVALDPVNDHLLHQQVAERMTTHVETRCPSLDGLLTEFADVEVAATMRYHGAVAAALAGAPVAMLAFSPKLTALADDLGSAAVVTHDLADLPRAVAEALAGTSHLTEKVEQLADLSNRNATVLDDLLEAA
ncbi:MAG: polysaccharide pyruvyl transferase family protein [Actinomycetota bacterium]|nr:polysaccharide pyruvyl transferase family protein [Actinomycetota bacterium]